MEWYEAEVRTLERSRHEHARPRDPVVFYGSSSLRLWDTLADDLASDRVINLGFGGSTLAACVHFFSRLVPPLGPSSLVVYAGDNDLGDGCPPDEVVRRFVSLADAVQRFRADLPFGFIAVKPSPARVGLLAAVAATNDGIRNAITRYANAYYIDVFTPMLTRDGRPRTELFLDDGLHMGRRGYRLWTAVLVAHHARIFPEACASNVTSER